MDRAFKKTGFFKPCILMGSRSLKDIDVDIHKKLVASVCYDKQHVYAYLQQFLHAIAKASILAHTSYDKWVSK